MPGSSSLTHFGLHVADADETAAFYEQFAGMRTIRTFSAGENAGVKTRWLKSADASNPFVLVLIGGKSPPLPGQPQSAIGPLSHFGFGLESREAVDSVAEKAGQAGVLLAPPRDGGEIIGYHCYLRDPNGHSVEFSFGQVLE